MIAATDWNDHFITQLQEEIAQQEQLVRRMIVRGAPTQAAEDALRPMEGMLERMKEEREIVSARRASGKAG
jgi:hypothetical protein